MTPVEEIKQKIQNNLIVFWHELEGLFNQSQSTIRNWIKENCPEIKFKPGKRKMNFTPKEAQRILDEYSV